MATTLIAKIAARAKVIRGKSKTMTWQTALKKAGAELKGSTVKTTSKRRTTVKKTTTKKVGDPYYFGDGKRVYVSTLKIGKKYEWIVGAEYLEVKYIGKSKDFPKIKTTTKYGNGGYLFEFDDGGFTNLSTPAIYQNLRTIENSVGKTKKAAQRLVKQSTPKIKKAAVDMDALNGVIKFQRGKFYEVIKGTNKGSVVKITSIRKPTNKFEGSNLINSYNVDFYEYRNGVLQKPFQGTLTDRWLNKRSIRPRLSVKANEYKRFK
jgi:hypothetical protein